MNKNNTEIVIVQFGALCFFLSTIEYLIPKPLPFFRLGLANIPIMLAVDILPVPSYCVLVLIKILGQGLIGGTLFSYVFLFSAAGTMSSACVMFVLRKMLSGKISFLGISTAGAFASNIGQLIMARLYIFGENAWYVAPPFLIVGATTGAVLGLFTNRFAVNSLWYTDIRSGKIPLRQSTYDKTKIPANTQTVSFLPNPVIRCCIGLVLLLILMFVNVLIVRIILTVLSLLLVVADGSRLNPVSSGLTVAGIICVNLFSPFGRIYTSIAGFNITEGALFLGIKKALIFEGMIFISKWMLKPEFRLPGKSGLLISRTFNTLRQLTARQKSIDFKNLISSIDSIMYELD